MSAGSPFRRRTAIWLYAVGITSFACAIALALFGNPPGQGRGSAGPDAFSRSAVGHRAFVDLLRRLGVPVVVSEHASTAAAGSGSVLVVAQPPMDAGSAALVEDLLDAPAVLLVLPKWSIRPSTDQSDWVDSARLFPAGRVEDVLSLVLEDGRIHRPHGRVRWDGESGPLQATPQLSAPQLVRGGGTDLAPIVASDEGILVGEILPGSRRILVLGDPDVISNHGIWQGDNALIAVRLVEWLRGPGGVVIVDETIHGYRQSPDFWRVLFEYPFVVATIQTLFAVLVLVWSATRRFGAPLPVAPELEAGKRALIDNTAALLEYGGHDRHVVRRYVRASLHDLGRRLNAPRMRDDDALWAWLGRLGESRGAPLAVSSLVREVERDDSGTREGSRRLLSIAERLYRWKKEILDGRVSG